MIDESENESKGKEEPYEMAMQDIFRLSTYQRYPLLGFRDACATSSARLIFHEPVSSLFPSSASNG